MLIVQKILDLKTPKLCTVSTHSWVSKIFPQTHIPRVVLMHLFCRPSLTFEVGYQHQILVVRFLFLFFHPSGRTWIQRRVISDDICREPFGSQLWHQFQGRRPHVDHPTGANGGAVALSIRRDAGLLHSQGPEFRSRAKGKTALNHLFSW